MEDLAKKITRLSRNDMDEQLKLPGLLGLVEDKLADPNCPNREELLDAVIKGSQGRMHDPDVFDWVNIIFNQEIPEVLLNELSGHPASSRDLK